MSDNELVLDEELRDVYQEVTNVAMGQAADSLARLLNVFVVLPIPNVNILEAGELQMALQSASDNESVSAVCQGFIGKGVAGEALLIFNDSSFQDIAKLMKYEGEIDDAVQLELEMDIASILIGAFLNGLAEQLDMSFSQGHPVVLGQHCDISELISSNSARWSKVLTLEINYTIKDYNINCDLLLLFSDDSIDRLNEIASYLLE
ncbi:histidine kinase [Litoribacillus peritrichatus]|uniref:Chemotaxis protein CheC n=1 Tax=Litoribacillus peritrichatus TaxID=718191 RepID=A0ABP7MLH2_9GAMM